MIHREFERLLTVLGALTSMLKTSTQLRLENLALRQQLAACVGRFQNV